MILVFFCFFFLFDSVFVRLFFCLETCGIILFLFSCIELWKLSYQSMQLTVLDFGYIDDLHIEIFFFFFLILHYMLQNLTEKQLGMFLFFLFYLLAY